MTVEELAKALGLRRPTAEQAEVAKYPPVVQREEGTVGAPLLVVAGAGSGKTETLSLRAIYMVHKYGVPPASILGLTFTRKAAGELADRLGQRVRQLEKLHGNANSSLAPHLAQSPLASTYNAFALDVVQEFGPLAGIDPQVGHLDQAAAWQLMSEVVAGWTGDIGVDRSPSTIVDKALALRDDIANQGLMVAQVRQGLRHLADRFDPLRKPSTGQLVGELQKGLDTVQLRLELLDIIDRFEAVKAQTGKMDYTDQVIAAIRIVEGVPEAVATLRERHRVVFLDEFQDTSVAQMRFLSKLFSDHPVTAVGDPNQAIYGWRGASSASLLDFHSQFNQNPSVPRETLTLSTAWRNDRAILEAANVLAEPLSRPPTYVSRTAGSGPSRSLALPQLEARKSAPVGHSQVSFSQASRDSLEEIADFVSWARRTIPGEGGGPASVAVLSRTNRPLRRVVEALRSRGIAAQLVGGDSLLGHPTVRDLRAGLAITTDPGASPSLLRLLTNLDLGAADLKALGSYADRAAFASAGPDGQRPPVLLLEAVDDCGSGKTIPGLSAAGSERVAALGRLLRELRSASAMSVLNQVQNARQLMRLDDEGLVDPTSEDVTAVLDEFTDVAAQYQASAEDATMEAFLGWLEAAEERERGLSAPSVDVDPQTVQVMTIHASKGLEWDAVVVADVAAGRFPSQGAGAKKTKGTFSAPPNPGDASLWWTDAGMLPYPLRNDWEHLPGYPILDGSISATAAVKHLKEELGAYKQDEERRLAYVAVTRARHALLLTGSWFDSGTTPRFPSTFAAELFAASTPGSGTADFLDGCEHSLNTPHGADDTPEGDAVHPLTAGHLAGLPPEEEWSALASSAAPALFPREPGPFRRKSEQVAARIKEHQEALSSTSGTQAALAALSDQALADDLDVLISRAATRATLRRDEDPEATLRRAGRQRPLSVTEIAGFRADPETGALALLRPVPNPPGSAALLGTQLHRWLEQRLRRLSSSNADPDIVDEGSDQVALDPRTAKHLEDMKKAAGDLYLLRQLKVAGIEVPFSVTSGGSVVRGRIDAVFQDDDGNYVLVDWKTSLTPKTSMRPEEVVRYSTQLDYYGAAWETKAEQEGVDLSSRLVYIYPGGTWTVTDSDLEALRR